MRSTILLYFRNHEVMMKNDIRKDVVKNPRNATNLDKMVELGLMRREERIKSNSYSYMLTEKEKRMLDMVEGLIEEIGTKD